MKIRDIAWISFLAILIIVGYGLITNSINIHDKKWDFYYYIDMARNGFAAPTMSSPFAYRYGTTMIVHALALLGLSIENGFQAIAYLGIIFQLTGIFFFTEWVTKSRKGAYLAMGVTALSLFHVKFLLFDIYRPDHLAYPLILLQTVLAFKKKFPSLLIVTLIASQIREFNIIPLLAYIFMRATDENRRAWLKEAALSILLLFPAIVLPRLLIPVTVNFQVFDYSLKGLIIALALPLIILFDINFYFSVFGYVLPMIMLATPGTIKNTFGQLPEYQRRYLIAYTLLVLLLTCLGGTDIYRFVTYLFLPQIILIGMLASTLPAIRIAVTTVCMIIFNRLWLPLPDWDTEKYRDFYGGSTLRWNMQIIYRSLELTAFIVVGLIIRTVKPQVFVKGVPKNQIIRK